MAPIHVDESAGSDETGKGTPDQPYQSLAFAIFTDPTATLLVRNGADAPYEEPTQSALKKAKKNADGLEKKRKKAQELAERAAAALAEPEAAGRRAEAAWRQASTHDEAAMLRHYAGLLRAALAGSGIA